MYCAVVYACRKRCRLGHFNSNRKYLLSAATFWLALIFSVAVATALFALQAEAETKAADNTVTVYDSDPNHLWNRLYAALFIRKGPDGELYGTDSLDPYLWPNTTFLLE